MLGTVPWWAVTLLGWVFVLGGLGSYFLPDYRPPLPRDAKTRDTSNGLLLGGIGLVLVVTSLFVSPWWALLAYAGVIGSATVIRLQIRRHANDLQTFLSETTAAPVTLATPKSFGTRYWRGRWSPIWLRCVVFGHDWHQRSSTHPPTLEAFKQDYDLIETVTECQRCGQIGNVKDKLERRQESVSATGAQGLGWHVR
jgi:hypothetical protein